MDRSLLKEIERQFQGSSGTTQHLELVSAVSGGSINEAYHLSGGTQNLFLKVNRSDNLPALFQRECDGLRKLHRDSKVKTPKVYLHGSTGQGAFLLMEWICSEHPTDLFWERLASGLAEIHREEAAEFGLDHDNYMGSLPQSNRKHATWASFWVEERILHQLRMCAAELPAHLVYSMEQCCARAEELFPEEPPALIHGDLWIGNVMTGREQSAWLVDPAVYYGHREMDLGMTRLFGGFSDTFYRTYQNAFPMESGWEHRMDLAMLYPLLIHVNLFGLSYARQIEQIMKKWGF